MDIMSVLSHDNCLLNDDRKAEKEFENRSEDGPVFSHVRIFYPLFNPYSHCNNDIALLPVPVFRVVVFRCFFGAFVPCSEVRFWTSEFPFVMYLSETL